jgi:hypothetical protein
MTLLFFFGASTSPSSCLLLAVAVVVVEPLSKPNPTALLLPPASDPVPFLGNANSPALSSLGVGRPASIELELLDPVVPVPNPGGTNRGGSELDCGGGGILSVVTDEAADPSLSDRWGWPDPCPWAEAETAGEGGTGVEDTDKEVDGCPE